MGREGVRKRRGEKGNGVRRREGVGEESEEGEGEVRRERARTVMYFLMYGTELNTLCA